MFFEADRRYFFKPLNGCQRELMADCLRTAYDRLHGPGVDYSQSLTRELLREVWLPVIQAHANDAALDDSDVDDEWTVSGGDQQQFANGVIRTLYKCGWLETYGDRAGLVTAYKFSRAGKLFAEALWSLDRLRARSRQRNVRSCRNALEATRRNVDAYDLIDAYDYAEKVISDLSEGVEYFQELVRRLMSEASQTPWDEFMEFLDKFEKDFKKQLTVDSVERHRQAIRESVARLRSIEDDKYRMLSARSSAVLDGACRQTSSGGKLSRWALIAMMWSVTWFVVRGLKFQAAHRPRLWRSSNFCLLCAMSRFSSARYRRDCFGGYPRCSTSVRHWLQRF